ncbi:helix-turn-helix transcriptional regulator [Methylobacterium sp.]|uniref:helix-turn-helix transcriptional regulator n=1 Tax=Methylobacterium sp. TaxID=409 RepID=UPI003C768F00
MEIAIVRAAHLHVYLDELRAIGVPVERELARSRLPSWIEEAPDAYLSIPLGLEWLARCSHDIELMDFGFRASRRGTLASLSAPLRHAVLDAPTGFARMRALLRLATLDDSALATRMQPEGDQVRVICDLEGLCRNPFICLGEWLSLQAMISIVQSVAGPAWRPPEMTFVARQRPSAAAQEAFPDTRILVGQPHTSILVGRDLLAGSGQAGAGGATGRSPADIEIAGWSFPAALRSAIRPYLADGYPALPLMAEVVGLSGRTLQRRLQQCGRTYSEVVQEARFDLARELLVDPAARVIDVAMAAGYENPQHFARAFRQLAGVSPTAYRRSAAATGAD